MAAPRHSNDDEIPPAKAGAGVSQSIVELVSATPSGLVFWSRHPFEVAAEVQLRVRSNILPVLSEQEAARKWVMKRGLVVQCTPDRLPNGSVGFQVSVLFTPFNCPSATAASRSPQLRSQEAQNLKRLSGLN